MKVKMKSRRAQRANFRANIRLGVCRERLLEWAMHNDALSRRLVRHCVLSARAGWNRHRWPGGCI